MITQLISIPLALRFLSHEQFGLWTFTSQSIGYLLLLDLGVTSSIGRLMAEPLHGANDFKHWNGWYNLFLIIIVIQALIIFILGMLLVEPILRWFRIPLALHDEAKNLWVMMLVINAIAFPFRLYPGLLSAQNRSYWAFLASTLSVWVGLATFYLFLKLGFHSLAYGYSSMATMVCATQITFWAVRKGPHRFRLNFYGLPWGNLREVFGFSSAIFIVGIAVQVAWFSQSLIIARLIGLSAVASFTVCSRVPMLLMQLIWKPFDAFSPLWQIHWVRHELPVIRQELAQAVRLTFALALSSITCCFAANRWFVDLFAHQDLYQGKWFDFFFALFVLAQVWNHCLSYTFILTKRLKWFTWVICLDTALGLVFCIITTRSFGVVGYIAGASLYTCISVGFWYNSLMGPSALEMTLSEILRDVYKGWAILGGVFIAGASVVIVAYQYQSPTLFGLEVSLFIASPATFIWLYHEDLIGYYQKLKTKGVASQPQDPPATVSRIS